MTKTYEELNEFQKLVVRSLAEKWNKNKNNHYIIGHMCPFCRECNLVCINCSCPPEICDNHGRDGLLGKLYEIREYFVSANRDGYNEIYRKIVNEFAKMLEGC